jgi:hypothetical protein
MGYPVPFAYGIGFWVPFMCGTEPKNQYFWEKKNFEIKKD